MKKKEAETKRTRTTRADDARANLDRQYGRIGISAVAAALPFVGQAKNTGQASGTRDEDRETGGRRRSILAV